MDGGKKLNLIDSLRLISLILAVLYTLLRGVHDMFFMYVFVEVVTFIWKRSIIKEEFRETTIQEICWANTPRCEEVKRWK